MTSRKYSRRDLMLGAGALGLTGALASGSALSQTLPFRDPRPEYKAWYNRPQPGARAIQRWDVASGNLAPGAGATLDEQVTYYDNSPTIRIEGSGLQRIPLINYIAEGDELGRGAYHLHVIFKGERVGGPISSLLDLSYNDGATGSETHTLISGLGRFDWINRPAEFGIRRVGEFVTSVGLTMQLRDGGIIWLAAVELVDLSLPESSLFFQEGFDGEG